MTPPLTTREIDGLIFTIEGYLTLAAQGAAETLESIGAARARLAELRGQLARARATTTEDAE